MAILENREKKIKGEGERMTWRFLIGMKNGKMVQISQKHFVIIFLFSIFEITGELSFNIKFFYW